VWDDLFRWLPRGGVRISGDNGRGLLGCFLSRSLTYLDLDLKLCQHDTHPILLIIDEGLHTSCL